MARTQIQGKKIEQVRINIKFKIYLQEQKCSGIYSIHENICHYYFMLYGNNTASYQIFLMNIF